MPNWCFTDITIYHNDEEKVKSLKEKIDKWTSKDFVENGFGHNWLGNIVGNSGIAKWVKQGDRYDFEHNIRCRGSLDSISLDNHRLMLQTSTAWAPMMQMWVKVCEKYLPDADILFVAEEPGNGIFETNDPDMIGSYYIDIWEPPEEFIDEEPMFEAEEGDVVDFLQRVLKTDETDIKKLLKISYDIEDQWFAINQWQECNIDMCE